MSEWPRVEGTAEVASAIEARSLSVGYRGVSILADVAFTLGRGRTLALIGANGSGKTTLLRTIAALLPALAGELRVLGGAPGASPARVAWLGQFQPTALRLPLRSIDVVRMGRFAALGLLRRASAADERMVNQAMEVMAVADLWDAPLEALSGGQRQRVLMAQALARGANLLLLDEPGANLDRASRETYRRVIRAAAATGLSAVIATHDVEEAESCDHAMLLARRVVAFGSGREIASAWRGPGTGELGHCCGGGERGMG